MSIERGQSDVFSLRDAINRLMEDSFVLPSMLERQQSPNRQNVRQQSVPVNAFEEGDNFTLFMPMPGLHPEDVELGIAEGVLTVKGNMRGPGQERHTYLLHEWTVGPYQRTLRLPENIDYNSARASMDNGVLVVTFNKTQAGEPRKIPVRVTDKE